MELTNARQWANKSLKIEREKEIASAWKAGMQNALMMISAQQKPGQSPGDDKSGDNRHDKDWPPKPPLKPKLAAANNIKKTDKPLANDDAYGEGNVPGHPDWSGINKRMTIAGGPSFDIGPGHGAAKKKAKGFNKTRNNPNDAEVKMIKKMLGGPELPDLQASANSNQIRNRLKPFTRGGPADYDKEGGSLRDIPASLRIQLLRDAKA